MFFANRFPSFWIRPFVAALWAGKRRLFDRYPHAQVGQFYSILCGISHTALKFSMLCRQIILYLAVFITNHSLMLSISAIGRKMRLCLLLIPRIK
jgi:membrane-anchored protein YejM (alkaline phosphatase superfamily)